MKTRRDFVRLPALSVLLAGALFAVGAAVVPAAQAQTFKFANQGDALSMDPHSLNESFQLAFTGNIYEPLIGRGKKLELVPALATEWKQTAPTVWRFNLRRNVQFHDGTPFTAEDVIFSYNRARGDGSDVKTYVGSIKEIRKIDDHTIDIVTSEPFPILPDVVTNWYIMSKKWSEENRATQPVDKRKFQMPRPGRPLPWEPFKVEPAVHTAPDGASKQLGNPGAIGRIDASEREIRLHRAACREAVPEGYVSVDAPAHGVRLDAKSHPSRQEREQFGVRRDRAGIDPQSPAVLRLHGEPRQRDPEGEGKLGRVKAHQGPSLAHGVAEVRVRGVDEGGAGGEIAVGLHHFFRHAGTGAMRTSGEASPVTKRSGTPLLRSARHL